MLMICRMISGFRRAKSILARRVRRLGWHGPLRDKRRFRASQRAAVCAYAMVEGDVKAARLPDDAVARMAFLPITVFGSTAEQAFQAACYCNALRRLCQRRPLAANSF